MLVTYLAVYQLPEVAHLHMHICTAELGIARLSNNTDVLTGCSKALQVKQRRDLTADMNC